MSVELLKQIIDAKRLVFEAKQSIIREAKFAVAIAKLNDALQVLVAMEESMKE